jgi:hypothetical protein
MKTRPSAKGVNAFANNLTQEQRRGRQLLLNDIGDKWHKFSWYELDALEDRHDLVARVAAKYGIDQAAAGRDVDGVLEGRTISL